VDLVDSTAWTQHLDLGVLSRALTRFDATASEVVVEYGGRVVKLFGDEIMFIADDPATGADIALALGSTSTMSIPMRAAIGGRTS
jgi:adenylate cyclase